MSARYRRTFSTIIYARLDACYIFMASGRKNAECVKRSFAVFGAALLSLSLQTLGNVTVQPRALHPYPCTEGIGKRGEERIGKQSH